MCIYIYVNIYIYGKTPKVWGRHILGNFHVGLAQDIG